MRVAMLGGLIFLFSSSPLFAESTGSHLRNGELKSQLEKPLLQ